ncbi:hypothetical protein BDM02DRAFT_1632784 [Thelephora ganbajun]|uniref:Uncharacterized protein n=1 Tax=Thelephora ganbajun TaxID=370292 RepID=A0ACB6ZW43_THEGA|nr:hypothetical protein BDM02DRAFT_1632784 [Thelephora ganbajun]
MLSPELGSVKHGLTFDAGLREAVEEGFLVVEEGLVVPTLEGGLEPALREAGLEDAPSTAFEVGFAFEAGLITLDAGLVALEVGLVAFEAGLVALEAGLVFWEATLFLLLIRLGLLGAWFGWGLFRGGLGLSSWLLLDASRAAKGYIGVGGGGSGFRFSNHDNRR